VLGVVSAQKVIIGGGKFCSYTLPMSGDRPTTLGRAQLIACPKCDARFPFYRSPTPRIDSCGFESYSLECKECGTQLAGIIDPNDEELLLSELES
jgi:hypothetical protein